MSTGRNAEGYADPTAFLGMKNVQREEQMPSSIRIEYRNGRIVLYLMEFFPCTVSAARKIFPLINAWADEREKINLRRYLTKVVRDKQGEIEDLSGKLEKCSAGYGTYRRLGAELKRAQKVKSRAERNLSFLEGGRDGEEGC